MSPAFAAANLLDSTEFLVGTGLLIAVLLGGAVVVWVLDRWRKSQERARNAATESLGHFRALFENGEITETEYLKIRDRMSGRIRTEVGIAPIATAPVAEPPPAPPPETPP